MNSILAYTLVVRFDSPPWLAVVMIAVALLGFVASRFKSEAAKYVVVVTYLLSAVLLGVVLSSLSITH
ncbi:MAG: hypothetical protein WC711_00885 [Candidatus Staskawiczbacteria bacterium]